MRNKKRNTTDFTEEKNILELALKMIDKLELEASKYDLTEHDKLKLSHAKELILIKAVLESSELRQKRVYKDFEEKLKQRQQQKTWKHLD